MQGGMGELGQTVRALEWPANLRGRLGEAGRGVAFPRPAPAPSGLRRHRRRRGGVPLVLGAADASVAAMPLCVAKAAGLIWAGIGGKRLLHHPFYRRWEAGTLASGELAAYAEQYRHIEAALPEVLSRVASNLPDGPARAAVNANLSDELGRPAPHLELFGTFAAAAGARRGAPPARRRGPWPRCSCHRPPATRSGGSACCRLRDSGRRRSGDESRRAAPPLRHRRPRRGVLGCARGPGSRPRRLDCQRAGRHRRQPRAGDQRGSGRSPRMVAVPRRTPDRGVDHRPRVGGFRATRWAVRFLLVGGVSRVPIKIPPDGDGHVRSARIAPGS